MIAKGPNYGKNRPVIKEKHINRAVTKPKNTNIPQLNADLSHAYRTSITNKKGKFTKYVAPRNEQSPPIKVERNRTRPLTKMDPDSSNNGSQVAVGPSVKFSESLEEARPEAELTVDDGEDDSSHLNMPGLHQQNGEISVGSPFLKQPNTTNNNSRDSK